MTAFDDFITLCALAGRPLVFFDFEATGLTDDARPCEFACVVLDAREPPADDETTAEVRQALIDPAIACGPEASYGKPVAYAVTSRLNPKMRIQPGATAIHGIKDPDVATADVPAYDDPEVIGLFRAFEEAGAVFCGHNVAGYDLVMAKRLGYVNAPPVIDTHRMARKFAETAPMPQAFDPTTDQPTPVCEGGLKVFRGDLSSLHYALCGWTFEGAHGALADVVANVRVFGRMVDLWFHKHESAETLRQIGKDETKARAALDALIAGLNTPPPSEVGWSGWFRRVTIKEIDHRSETSQRGSIVEYVEVMKGKNRGRTVDDVAPRDLQWIADLPDTDELTAEFIKATINARRR